jgi:alkaline phosphatase D
MSVGRREFIIASVGVAASSQLLTGCKDDSEGSVTPGVDGGLAGDGGAPIEQVNTTLFAHGVASGDPLADAVILWTRVTVPDGANVELGWVVSKDASLTAPVKQGTITATADADFTAKVDVTGLEAGTTYYYAFTAPGRGRSVSGRTRTLPTTSDHARIAFTSCANFQNGYFSAYGAIAKRTDLDLWIHLGDYIYEYKAGEYADANLPARAHLPAQEAITLADYRTRYAQYRADPDLLAIHRQLPLIAIWDDHEFANNAYVDGAENHNPELGEGDWTDRKRAGARAFLEWLPIRVAPAEPVPKIFRNFKFGDLFDLLMLDTRIIARAKQAGDDSSTGTGVGSPSVWQDPTRQLLGTEQEKWFLDELNASKLRGARWRLIGNQVIFTQARDPQVPDAPPPAPPMTRNILYSDFWDGYQPARQRVIDYLLTNGIQNVVFMTGDIHTSWALEVSNNPFDPTVYNPDMGKPGFAIEIVGPSVTSQALEDSPLAPVAPMLLAQANPQLRYAEVTKKGYVLLDVTNERIQAEWYYVNQYKVQGDSAETFAKSFTCQQSSARLVEATTPSAPKVAPAPAA